MTSKPVQSYLSYSLASAHRTVHTSLSRRLREFGVQVETWRVIEILEGHTDLTMGDLAGLVLMNPPTLTKLVDRMVADGLVHRRSASVDQRKVNLQITALGQKRIAQIREAAMTEENELLSHISAERAALLKSILAEISNARR